MFKPQAWNIGFLIKMEAGDVIRRDRARALLFTGGFTPFASDWFIAYGNMVWFMIQEDASDEYKRRA